MKIALNFLAGLVLTVILVVPLLFVTNMVSETTLKTTLLVGTILWFIALLPHMRAPRRGAGLLIAAGLALSASPVIAQTVPVELGEIGYVNATNGDSMWDAFYYERPDFDGEARNHFERIVGEGLGNAAGDNLSAVWSATVAARNDGIYRFRLKGNAPASVDFDGEQKMTLADGGSVTFKMPLRSTVPMEIAVRVPNINATTQLALEWEFVSEDPGLAESGTADATVLGPVAGSRIGTGGNLENARFRADVQDDGTFTLVNKSLSKKAEFSPEFIVVARPADDDPKYLARGTRYADDGPVGATNYFVSIWDKNPDYFDAARPRWQLRATEMTIEGNQVSWTFQTTDAFELSAELELPADGSEPIFRYSLTPRKDAFFSVGFAGAPKILMNEADWIWQPLVWTDQRFPNRSYLTPEYQCTIPFVMAGIDGVTVGVGADSSEMPFRMPLGEDSGFGVVVRNPDGFAQPQVFAPILGGAESKRAPGEKFDFVLRLFVGGEGWYASYRDLARDLYGFGDQRENALGSLNETIENMTEFFLHDDFSYWNKQHKSWGYQNDMGPEGIRQQSAAYPFSLALVLDSPEILHERAIPTLEYMLTRNRSGARSSDADLLGGPNRYPLDYIATHRLLGERNAALRKVAEETSPVVYQGEPRAVINSRGQITEDRLTMLHALGVYRLTKDQRWLEMSKEAADRYIEAHIKNPSTNFGDTQSSFWPELAPAYDGFFELYEETGDKRYLDAAHEGLGKFSAYVYLTPEIPDAPFLANPGGEHLGVKIAEESVPAWRVSPNGLTAEGAATAHSHRGIFMAPYAGYMLRVAGKTDDNFLREIARSSTVGRYMNYPTYAYRYGLTTIFEKPDYPLRSFEDIKKITSAHYNHPLPMTAFLVDYIVSDVADRSDGKIESPSEYTNTGAYFRTKVYGAAAGRFFEDANVFLWMPAKLIETGSIQLNYLSARGNNTLYVALSNQSCEPVETWIQVNPKLAELPGTRSARAWVGDSASDPISVIAGKAQVSVPAKGLLSIAIPDVAIQTRVQEAMLDSTAPQLTGAKSETFRTNLGDLRVTPITYGKGLTMVHVLVVADVNDIGPVTLRHSTGGTAVTRTTAGYPYEFTIPVPDSSEEFEFSVDTTRADGMELSSGSRSVRLR